MSFHLMHFKIKPLVFPYSLNPYNHLHISLPSDPFLYITNC